MMEQEKLVKTPLGTDDPNIAKLSRQLRRQISFWLFDGCVSPGTCSLLRVGERFKTMSPVEVGSLETDTRLRYSSDRRRTIVFADPLGGGGSIGHDEEENDTNDQG